MKFSIPEYVQNILNRLHSAGYEAYIVGGCVRDFLMGRKPHDFDVCTSATPQQIKDCFSDHRTIDTGIDFGTVIVLESHYPVEITTYRTDGQYRDSRHPESVNFTSDLKEDLARRDFTMNAIAYSENEGLVDFYDGVEAINKRKIKAVGNGEERFREDALRIMRGLRFSAVLNFSIEEETARAMKIHMESISDVSGERIQAELSKMIMGENADMVIKEYGEGLTKAIYGFRPEKICNLPLVPFVRLAELFPENTEECLKKLRYDKHTIRNASEINKIKKEKFPADRPSVLRLLNRYGEEITSCYYERYGRKEELDKILSEKPCYTVRQLAVTGREIIEAGCSEGPETGKYLKLVLNQVIDGKLGNTEREILEFINEERKYE